MQWFWRLLASVGILFAGQVMAAQPSLSSGSVVEAAEHLKAGEFLWAPQVAPEGPVLLIVSLATQRAVIYRNGIPIGIATVSTGRPGHRTPTGVFTVLQRQVEHHSSLYNDAPMPYMQRLTWGGVALHGGNLPGYPASHGCIRLPQDFARLLYGVTRLGMTVIITDQTAVPRIAPSGTVLGGSPVVADPTAVTRWRPEASPTGPVSIVISASDRRVIVLRNGIVIGSAPAAIDGPISHMFAYVMRASAGLEHSWLRIALPGQMPDPAHAAEPELRGRIHVTDAFRSAVQSVLQPGSTIVVTPDSLRSGSAGRRMTVIDVEAAPPARAP